MLLFFYFLQNVFLPMRKSEIKKGGKKFRFYCKVACEIRAGTIFLFFFLQNQINKIIRNMQKHERTSWPPKGVRQSYKD